MEIEPERKESQRKEIALKKEAIGLRAGNAKDRVRESGERMLSTALTRRNY